MKNSLAGRIFLTVVGAALILVGISNIALGIAGRRTTAVVTSIRREGGERTDGKPGRYTYSIGYTFTLPDGRKINGASKRISDSVYLKADGSSTARVRYFEAFPYLSAMETDTGLGLGQMVMIVIGAGVIAMVNPRQKSARP